MNHLVHSNSVRVLLVLLAAAALGGCAAAVVTGAATGAAVAHDRRTTGSFVEDQEIRLKALRLLHENADIKDQSNISVSSYNMQVLLTGQSASDDVSGRYADLVARIPRVRRVFNEVVTGAESTWGEAADDLYMESKVKIALFDVGIEGFDPLRVKVVASQGNIYLMGLLTQAEADRVTEKVRYLSGVKKVIRLFEYI